MLIDLHTHTHPLSWDSSLAPDDVIDIALRQKGEQVLGLLVEAGADLHEKLAPGRTAIDFIREILGNDTAESLCAPTTAEKTEKEQK